MTQPLYTINRSSYRAQVWWPHPFKTYPGPWKPPVAEKTGIEDSQPIENMNDTGSYGFYTGAIWGVGQSFTAKEGGKLASAKVWARQNATNTEYLPLTARIYESAAAVGSALPEGAPLAASDPFDPTPLVAELTPVEFLFTGANQIQFEQNKVYCLTIERPDVASLDVIRFGFYMGAQKQHPGQFFEARAVGWIAQGAGFDLIFYVYST